MFTHMTAQMFTSVYTQVYIYVYTHDYTMVYTHEKDNFTQRHPPPQTSAHIYACSSSFRLSFWEIISWRSWFVKTGKARSFIFLSEVNEVLRQCKLVWTLTVLVSLTLVRFCSRIETLLSYVSFSLLIFFLFFFIIWICFFSQHYK